jgi:hypothetical protein
MIKYMVGVHHCFLSYCFPVFFYTSEHSKFEFAIDATLSGCFIPVLIVSFFIVLFLVSISRILSEPV